MSNTTANLANVNLLSKAQYDAIESPATDELWAVEYVVAGMPDYSATVTVTTATYTAPCDGIIAWNNAYSANCTINGNKFYLGGDDASNEGPVILSLSKDDVISFTKNGGTPCFTPFKGAI